MAMKVRQNMSRSCCGQFKVAAWTATPWDDGSGIQVHHTAAGKRKAYGVHVIHGP